MAKKKKEKAKKERKYSFPTASKCPRCNSTHTAAYSTQGNIQYRKCLVAICRHRYKVVADRI